MVRFILQANCLRRSPRGLAQAAATAPPKTTGAILKVESPDPALPARSDGAFVAEAAPYLPVSDEFLSYFLF